MASSHRGILKHLSNIPMPEYFTILEQWKLDQSYPSLVIYKQGTEDEHVFLVKHLPKTAQEFYDFARGFSVLECEEWHINSTHVPSENAAHDQRQYQYQEQALKSQFGDWEFLLYSEQDNEEKNSQTADKVYDWGVENYFNILAEVRHYNIYHGSSDKDEIHDHYDDCMLAMRQEFINSYLQINKEYFTRAIEAAENPDYSSATKKTKIQKLADWGKEEVTTIVKKMLEHETHLRKARAFHIKVDQYGFYSQKLQKEIQVQEKFIYNLMLDAANAGHAQALAWVRAKQAEAVELNPEYITWNLNFIIKEILSPQATKIELDSILKLVRDLSQRFIGSYYDAGNPATARKLCKDLLNKFFIKHTREFGTIWLQKISRELQWMWDLAADLSACHYGSYYYTESPAVAKAFSEDLFEEVSRVLAREESRRREWEQQQITKLMGEMLTFVEEMTAFEKAESIGLHDLAQEFINQLPLLTTTAPLSQLQSDLGASGEISISRSVSQRREESTGSNPLSPRCNASPVSISKVGRFSVSEIELSEVEQEAQKQLLRLSR